MTLAFEPKDDISSFGHHFLVGLNGVNLSDDDKLNLESLRPIGIILKRQNFLDSSDYITWHSQLTHLLQVCKSCIGREQIIVAIEEEGGDMHETPAPLTHFPDAETYASKSAAVGEALAKELASLGVNLLIGPVADVRPIATRSSLGRRIFADSTDEVIFATCNFVKSAEENGLLCCPKHFPGMGSLLANPAETVQKINLLKEELYNRDVKPFAALIDLGVSALAMSPVLYPSIEKDLAAFMSKEISKILRNKLEYQGVCITPALDTKELVKNFTGSEAVKNALCSHVDLLRVELLDNAMIYAENLLDVFKLRLVSEEDLHASFERIASLVTKTRNNQPYILSNELFEQHAQTFKR